MLRNKKAMLPTPISLPLALSLIAPIIALINRGGSDVGVGITFMAFLFRRNFLRITSSVTFYGTPVHWR